MLVDVPLPPDWVVTVPVARETEDADEDVPEAALITVDEEETDTVLVTDDIDVNCE